MTKKKILILACGYPDAVNPNAHCFTHNQSLALKQAGYEVLVLQFNLSAFIHFRKFGIYKDNIDDVNIVRVSIPSIGRFTPKKLLDKTGMLLAKHAYKLIMKQYGKFDVVHAHFGACVGNMGLAIKQKYNVPLVITEHQSDIIKKTIKPEYVSACYKGADRLVCVSSALKQVVESYYGATNAVVIPNVINTNLFSPQNKNKKEGDSFHFLSIGSLIERKGFQITLKAFAQIQRKYKNVFLTIIGEGPLEASLKQLVKDNGVKNVTFIRRVLNSNLSAVYNQADCFVLSSYFETFGVVCAEAVSCGVPVAATDNGGSRDIITPQNGVLFSKGSILEAASAMEYIITRKSEFDAHKMHAEAENRFGFNAFVKQIGAIYNEVCKA